MGSRLYNKIAVLIKRWPVEALSSEKVLGNHIKKTFADAYPHGPMSATADEQKLEQYYESCNRLVSNVHKDKYKRVYVDSIASAMDKKQFDNVIVDIKTMDTQYPTNEDHRGFMAKVKNTFKWNKQ